VCEEAELDAADGGEDANLAGLTLPHRIDAAAIGFGEFVDVPVVDVPHAGARIAVVVSKAAADFFCGQPALAGVVRDRNGVAEEIAAAMRCCSATMGSLRLS